MPQFTRRAVSTLVLGALLGATFPTLAAPAPGALQVEHAWSRATPPGAATGAAYFEINNTGKAADTLLGASAPVATSANVHEMKMANGVMLMRAVPQLAVPAKGHVSFTPQGYHVMLNGLKAPLKEGSHFALTLQFEHAGAVTVDVAVQAMGAATMDMAH